MGFQLFNILFKSLSMRLVLHISILQSLKYETRTKSYETKMVGSLNLETAQIIPETLEPNLKRK